MKRIKNLFVNWVDGMKIAKEHFIDQEHAMRDHLRDALMAGVSDHHFGLLEPADLVFEDREAKLNACRAICRDGSRIELLPEHEQHVSCDLMPMLTNDLEGKSFYLLAMLQADEREGVGPFVGEPPRQAVVLPRVSLQMLPVEKLNSAALRSAMLPVARFTVLQGHATQNKDFVAPCCSIDGFTEVERVKKDLANTLDLIMRNASTVLAKLYSKPRDIHDRFPNRCYEHWAIQSQLTLAGLHADMAIGMERPFELLRGVVQLAHTTDGIWQSMPERAELMKHVEGIGNWASLIRAQHGSMNELMQFRYLHWDLCSTLMLCARFLEQTRQTYAQLGELDRFEPVSILRDIAPNTVEEVKPIETAKPVTKGFVWEKKS